MLNLKSSGKVMGLPVELFIISSFSMEDGELNYYITSKSLSVVKGYIIKKINKFFTCRSIQ